MGILGGKLFALPSSGAGSGLDEVGEIGGIGEILDNRGHDKHRVVPPVVELDIVIPVLNEETRIGKTISEICRHLEDAAFTRRLLIVDNGSVDATAEVIDATALRGTRVEVISCGLRGKGAAVRAGVLASSATQVGYCDADLSTPPMAITAGLELIKEGWQAVIGSRRVDGSSYEVQQSLLRRAGSILFNRAAASLVGSMRDTQCGFKLFDGDLARRVFADVQLTGFAFDVELIARLLRSQAPMIELPVRWSDDEGSTFNLVSDGARAFRDLYLVRRALASSCSEA